MRKQNKAKPPSAVFHKFVSLNKVAPNKKVTDLAAIAAFPYVTATLIVKKIQQNWP